MTAFYLSILLLVISPVQDSVSIEQYENLEERVEELENEVEIQSTKEKYFNNILSSQRWTFVLALAVLSVLSYSVFRWRINQAKRNMEDNINKSLKDIKKEFDKNVSSINKEIEKMDETIDKIKGGMEYMSDRIEKNEIYVKREVIKELREDGDYISAIVEASDYLFIMAKRREKDNISEKVIRDEIEKVENDVENAIENDCMLDVKIMNRTRENIVEVANYMGGKMFEITSRINRKIGKLKVR